MRLNVHIYPSPMTHASRIEKITKFLIAQRIFSEIWILGTWDSKLPLAENWGEGRRVLRIPRPEFGGEGFVSKMVRACCWSVSLLGKLRGAKVACVNAHSLAVLPVCLVIKWWKRCKLVYDTHELETESVACTGIRRTCSRVLERALIRYVDATCVVSPSIERWYAETYGMSHIWTVRNIPEVPTLRAKRTTILRDVFGIAAEDLIFIYQGVIAPGRQIRTLLQAFTRVPSNRHLVIMGFGPEEGCVREYAANHANIHFHPAVEPAELLAYTGSADVGLFLLANCCLSYYYSLPNKVFEYLHAGLAIAVSDLPEVAAMVKEHHCGWIIDASEERIVDFVTGLSREAVNEKQVAAGNAQEKFSWRDEELKLRELYGYLYPVQAAPVVLGINQAV